MGPQCNTWSIAQVVPCRGRDGVVLVVVMCLIAALMLMSSVLYTVLRTDMRQLAYFQLAATAFHQADAGARYVVSCINDDLVARRISLTNPTETVSYAAPAGMTFDTVTNLVRLANPNRYYYTVTGRANDARAKVGIVVGLQWEGGEFFSDELLTISGGGVSTGDIGSNHGITLSGGSKVDGNAIPGPGYTVSPTSAVSGVFAPATTNRVLTPIDPAAIDAARLTNNNASIYSGYIQNGTELRVGGGTVTIAPGTYYFTKVTLSGGAKIAITGRTVIYCTGIFTLSGGGFLNASMDPDNLLLYCSGSGVKITYSGSSDAFARLYAPLASETVVSGGGDFYGTIITGGKLTSSGGSFLHSKPHGVPAMVTITSWKEISD